MKKKLIVISSPSGGGKDTIITKLINIFPNSVKLVTSTTRNPRVDDVPGVSYNFVSKENFAEKIENNELVEYNEYNGNYYGIEKSVLAETLKKNDFVFTNIDVNGKASLDKLGVANLSVFLLPESLDVLAERIIARGGVSDDDIEERLKTAKSEIKMSKNYDFKVYNREGQIDETVAKIKGIIDDIDK